MPWLKVDDAMWRNRKVTRVSPLAKCLWVWEMGYSADQLTDGILDENDLRQIAGAAGLDDWRGPMQELLDAGLMEHGENGTYIIHDYLDYNPTREEVLAERAESARRQAEWKAGKRRTTTPANTVSNGVSNAVTASVPSRPVPVPLTSTTTAAANPDLDPDFGAVWTVYESENLVNPISPIQQEDVADIAKRCRDPEKHREAIKRARRVNTRPPLGLVFKILSDYLETGSWDKPGGNGKARARASPSRDTGYPTPPPMTAEEQAREAAAWERSRQVGIAAGLF